MVLAGPRLPRPEPRPARPASACVLSVVGLVLLVYGIIKGGQLADFTDAAGAARPSAPDSLVLVVLRAVREAQRPPVHRRHATSRTRPSPPPIAAIALVFFALMGVTFFSVFYIQSVRGYCAAADRSADAAAGRRADDLRAARPAGRRPLRRPGRLHGGHAAGRRDAGRRSPLLDADTPIWVLEVVFFVHGHRRWRTSCRPPRRHHAVAAAREGRLRLRAQQHLPAGRRRPRRRRPRLGALHAPTATASRTTSAALPAGLRHAGGRVHRGHPRRRRQARPAGQALVAPGQRRLPARHARHRAVRRGCRAARRGRRRPVPAGPSGRRPHQGGRGRAGRRTSGTERRAGPRALDRAPATPHRGESPPVRRRDRSRREPRRTAGARQERPRRGAAPAARPSSAPSSRA